ncbi:MAG: hypothetical protein ACTSX9_01075 [Candidatus Njordarchaeales archaeon]
MNKELERKERIGVHEIIRVLGEEELRYLDSMKTRRQIIGGILMAAGLVSWGIMLYMAIQNPAQNYVWLLAGLIISPLLMREGSVAINEARSISIPGGGRYQVFSKIGCMKCEYTEIRPWREGEYVGLQLAEKCPKCDGVMVVKAIFGEPEKKIKPIGLPILQSLGGQTKVGFWDLLKYYLLDIFTPFRLAFRMVTKKLRNKEKGGRI